MSAWPHDFMSSKKSRLDQIFGKLLEVKRSGSWGESGSETYKKGEKVISFFFVVLQTTIPVTKRTIFVTQSAHLRAKQTNKQTI